MNFPKSLLSNPLEVLSKLGAAVQAFSDPVRREAELATAFAEIAEGEVPSLIADLLELDAPASDDEDLGF